MKLSNSLKIYLYTLLMLGVIIVIAGVTPFTIGLLKAGFLNPTVLGQFNFYFNLGIFLVGIFLFATADLILDIINKRENDKYGNGNGFASLGEKPSLKFFKRFTIPQITWLAFIFFLFVGIFAITLSPRQTAYTGVGLLESQQFTDTDNVIYSTFLVAPYENGAAGLVIIFGLFVLRALARKFEWEYPTFMVLAFVILTILVGLAGLFWHQMAYSSSEIASSTTFWFWILGGFLTILTGTFTIFLAQHMTNNFLYDINLYLSSDIAKIWVFVGLFVAIFLYIIIYRKRLLGDSTRLNKDIVAKY